MQATLLLALLASVWLSDASNGVLDGLLQENIKTALDYYLNGDRFVNEAIPNESQVENEDLYYNMVPSRSVKLFKGRRELYFKLDPTHKAQVDALSLRLKEAKTKYTDQEDKDMIDKMITDTARLRRLLVKLPNDNDMRDTVDTEACEYKLDRFFYGLDGIKFSEKENQRTKRANTRGRTNGFHAELLDIERKYEACLPTTQIKFSEYDSKKTTRDCGNEHWLKLTESVNRLVTTTPPTNQEENILAHRLIVKTVYAMPSVSDIEDIFKSKLILEYPHIVNVKDFEKDLLTTQDRAMMDTQLIISALPFLMAYEALFLARARRQQIKTKSDIQKVVWYIEGLKKIGGDFPGVDWTNKLYACDIKSEIPSRNREVYLSRETILAEDIAVYGQYCCTNREHYTCLDNNNFAQFNYDVTNLRDSVMLSYIAEERKQQKLRKREQIWPEILARKEKRDKAATLINVGKNQFQSTPIRPTSRDPMDLSYNLLELSGNHDDTLDREIDQVRLEFSDDGNQISNTDTNTPTQKNTDNHRLRVNNTNTNTPPQTITPYHSPTPTLSQTETDTPSNLDKSDHARQTRNDPVTNDSDDTTNQEQLLEAEANKNCYRDFNSGNDFDSGCTRLLVTDQNVKLLKNDAYDKKQTLRLFANIILDVISHVTHQGTSIFNLQQKPTLGQLSILCEDSTKYQHVEKIQDESKLFVYTWTSHSTLYMPTIFCSPLYCHTLISNVNYVTSSSNTQHCYDALRVHDDYYICAIEQENKPPPCYFVQTQTKGCRFVQRKNTAISSTYYYINDQTGIVMPSENQMHINTHDNTQTIHNVMIKSQALSKPTKRLKASRYFLSDLDILRLFDQPTNIIKQLEMIGWLASNLNTIGWAAVAICIILFVALVTYVVYRVQRYCRYTRTATEDIEMTDMNRQKPCNETIVLHRKRRYRNNAQNAP